MDKILIPKIEAPKLSPLDFDISLNSPLNSPEFSPIPTEKKEEDIIKKIQRDILNSPKVDLDKIDEQYQDKYVKVTPDELKKINKGDEISERIKFDDNYEALMRSTQTNTERYLNTAKNFGVAASSSFIGGLAAIPNIIGSTINVAGYLSGRDKPISEFFNVGWDSGLNKTLFEFSNEVAENNRNYKSNWSKENWIQDMIPIFGDGGFQDIVASSGYTVGAMAEAFLTGGIGSVISKGTRIAGMGGRISKYLNNPAKLDKMLSLFKAINKEDNVRKVIGEAGYLIGKGIEEAPQLYRMYAGSHFESAFEGLEGAKRFEEEAIQKYKENNFGMLPDQKTLENIKSTAQEIGDMRYGLNLAVLMIPNYLQMGALLKTFPGAEKFSKKVFGENTLGEIVSDSGKFSVKKTKDIKLNWTPEGKVGKFLKNAAEKTIKYGQEYSKIPLSFSEGMEEYMQYIIDEYSNSLYKGVYMHPETSIKTGEYISEMFKTIADKGLNKEAIQSFLMGSIGGGIQQTFNTGYEIATGSNRLKNKIAQNEIIASKLEGLSKSIFSKDSMKESVTEEDKKMLIDILSNSLNQNSLGGTLEEKYNQALSSLNSLSVLENILKSESVHAQRWYYNIKDRHISQILHDVVETGKQDVFKDHLSQIASSPVEVINQLYNIDINEQTRDHTLFVNDVLDKLNKIENISKTIKFSFNDDFKDPLTQIKYSQYKRELSHMKFMIDRQKERRNGLMSPKINSLSKFLTSDYSELENRINTLKLVQPDTQDYTNVQEELKRLENALDLIKKSTTYEVIENEDGEEIEVLDNVNLQNIADAYNLIENNNENTTKTAYEDLVKANDIKIIDESLSNNSNTIKRYKKLYNDFNFYLEENKDYFKVLDEIFAKEERLKNIKKEVDKEFDKESDKTKLDIISEIIQIEENDKLSEEEKKTQKESVIQKFKDKLKPVEKVKDNVVNKSQETPDLSKDAEKEKEKDATSVVDKEKLDDVSKIINNTNIEPLFLHKDTIKKQLENLSYSEKINKLIELGILTSLNVDGKLSNDINDVHLGWTVDRPIVFMKLGNDIVPFYRSSKGTGGKEKNRWYPFFGFGTDGWVIKGTVPEMERYYDNPLFKLVGDILTEEINYEGGLDLQKGNLKDFHPLFSKGEKSLNSKQINLLLYQKETIEINNLNQGFDKNIQYNKIKTLLDNWNTYLSNIKNKNQSNTQDVLNDKVLESVAEIVNDAQTSDKSENYNQVGNSNYYEKDGLVFYQNEDGTLKPIPNPDKKDVLEVVKADIEERRRFETVYVEDRLKKEADLAKTLDFTNHRDERLWELLGMFFQAITEFTSKGKNYTIVKGFSKYYKNVLDEEGNVVIVISRSGLEYDIHNTSREDAKEILSHAQKKGYDENKEKQINDKYDKELESLNQQNTQKQPTTDIEAKKADIEKRRQEKLIFTFGKNIDVISSGRLAVIERNVYFTPKYPKGANRLANREDAEKLVNEYIEINAEYDKELAKELYKEMESGKMITEFTPDEQKILNKYNTPELRKSVEEELEKLEENFNTKDLEGQEFTILYFGGNNENGEFDDNYIKKSTDEFYFQIIPDENGKTGRLIPNTSLSTVNTIIQNSNVFQNSLAFNKLSFTPTKMDILKEGVVAKTNTGWKVTEKAVVNIIDERETEQSLNDEKSETLESNIENQQLESTQEIDQNEDELLLNKENENTGTPIPPISKPVSSVPNSKDNIIFMQNDFYLNDTGLGVLNKKKGNEMLLKRRKFLNSINNVSDIDFKVDKTIITLDEIEKQEIAGGKLLKINNAPIFVISTKQDDEEIILQEYRDLRNGWGISKQYLQSLGIELEDNFDFNSENIVNAKNFESISGYVSLFNVIEYLEENNTNELEELLDNLGIERSYLDLSIERQKTLEKSLEGKNVKLKRLLTNYISSKTLQGSTLNSNYTELVPVDELPNNKVIDENGNQYTAILYLDIPYTAINEEETSFSNSEEFRDIISKAIRLGNFYGNIPENLQNIIKQKLIAQLNETIVNEKGEVVLANSPATFLSNGFNLIFTDTETNKPYVKNLVSKDISLPDTTDLVSLIKTNEKKGDVRDDGWFINISGVQEQLNTKFEIYKVEYNNFENEKEKILGISILYGYKDNNGKTIFWRTNYNLDGVKKQNTIEFLKRKIKEDINKKFNPVTDKKDVNFNNFLKNISINFVSSTSKKFKTYEDVVAQNSHVVKGIEFKSGSDDMRNDTTYSFFHDRVEIVSTETPNVLISNNANELQIITPTVTKVENIKEEETVKAQISPELNVENESELIKFFSTFGIIKLNHNFEGVEEILEFNKGNFYILEEIINKDSKLKNNFNSLIKNKAPLSRIVAVLKPFINEINLKYCN